ncbi:DUF6404 family protein [Marinomonas dokdonensis]|uniref:DUF6404 family protein n=1 Tax=Marinomonas dokdonensis TaxID=328224 RepID=UPI003289907A
MSFKEKLQAAHAELEERKVWRSNYLPPMFSLLRVIGIKVPPPYYLNFHLNVLIAFIYLTSIMLIVFSLGQDATIQAAFDKSVVWGFAYGVFMAIFYKIRSRKLQLTPWSSL